MKILLFGGSGKLGKSIQKSVQRLSPQIEIVAPSHVTCDITNKRQVKRCFDETLPDVVINSAAIVGLKECESDKEKAWQVNVFGNRNIVRCCHDTSTRMVYISSAAIFDGKNGNYKETDVPTPTFYYALTKTVAEEAVLGLKDKLVIRLDFFSLDKLKYETVFTDHYTSKIPVNLAARAVLQLAIGKTRGIINIGQERKSLFDILKKYYPSIKPIKISESTMPNFPKDISLNLTKFILL